MTSTLDKYPLITNAKMICGRRADFNVELNQLRSEIYTNSQSKVEVISYDRILDALEKMQGFKH